MENKETLKTQFYSELKSCIDNSKQNVGLAFYIWIVKIERDEYIFYHDTVLLPMFNEKLVAVVVDGKILKQTKAL